MANNKIRHLSKIERKRLRNKQKQIITEQKLALKQHKQLLNQSSKRFPSLIETIEKGQLNLFTKRKSYIEPLLNQVSKRKHLDKNSLFKQLLTLMFKSKCFDLLENEEYVKVLFSISLFVRNIKVDVETWQRKSRNPRKQIISLIRFCFVLYDMPAFMDEVWFSNNKIHQKWYVEIGAGENPKRLSKLPILMTSKMAHLFFQLPTDLSVNQAFRYLQVIVNGGTVVLARAVANSWLSRNNFQNEVFWLALIRIFCSATMFNLNKVPEIIDFLRHELIERPTISMKGRSIASLLRQSDEWHEQISKARLATGNTVWKHCNVDPIVLVKGTDGDRREYHITELTSSKDLFDEGRKLGHCVATYVDDCVKKRVAIFSLRICINAELVLKTLATIEVDLRSHTIVQAKSKFNAPITEWAMMLLNTWANKNNLRVSNYL